MFKMNFSRFQTEHVIHFEKDVGIPYDYLPNYPYIFRALSYRNKIKMNTFVIIVGNPRTSKSYCSMKIAEEYSKLNNIPFDVEKQLTFDDVKKFLMWSKDAHDSIFILDETGTSLSPDSFWSLQQRIMRRFCQTQGFRRNVLIWNLPSIVFIQKGFRFLTNYAIKTRRQGSVDVYKIIVDQLLGKGFPDKIETMTFGLPGNEIIEKYEPMKKEWNDIDLQGDIDWINELEKPHERKFNAGFYIDSFRNFTIDSDELKKHLSELGYKQEDIDIMLENEINKSFAQLSI